MSRDVAGVHGGRVQEPPGPDGNHLGLTVRMPDGETWLVDVGLGDGPAEPLPSPRASTTNAGSGTASARRPSATASGVSATSPAAASSDSTSRWMPPSWAISWPCAFPQTETSFATTVTVQRRVGERLEILRGCTARALFRQGAQQGGERRGLVGLVLDHFGLAYGDLSADERSSLWRRPAGDA